MKYILDIDTGIDDSLAITYLLTQAADSVLGFSCVFGNVTVDQGVINTKNLIGALGHGEIPVFRGAAHPLKKDSYLPDEIKIRVHGTNGIGEAYLPDVPGNVSEMPAHRFFIEAANTYGKDLTIIAVGPMTNLALAILEDPEAMKKVGSIVVMGGALTVPGNHSPYAEANFACDADAAKLLMESGLPITMVGLDVTQQTIVTDKEIVGWKNIDHVAAKALYDMCVYYYTNEADAEQEMGGCLHDPLAVETALNPGIITRDYWCDLSVEDSGVSIGRSIGDRAKILGGARTTRACLRVDAETFVAKFASAIEAYLKNLA